MGDLRQGHTDYCAPLDRVVVCRVLPAPLFIWTLGGGGGKSPVEIPASFRVSQSCGKTIKNPTPKSPSMLCLSNLVLYSTETGLFALYGFGGILRQRSARLGYYENRGFRDYRHYWRDFFSPIWAGFWQKHKGTKSVLMQCVVFADFHEPCDDGNPPAIALLGLPLSESTITVIFYGVWARFLGWLGRYFCKRPRARCWVLSGEPPKRIAEAFGLYAFSGRADRVFWAPFLIAVATGISGSQRLGLLPRYRAVWARGYLCYAG